MTSTTIPFVLARCVECHTIRKICRDELATPCDMPSCKEPNCYGFMVALRAGLAPIDDWDEQLKKEVELIRSKRARDEGISQVVGNSKTFQKTMRDQARFICDRQGFVTMDDVRAWADKHDIQPHHCNAWGGVFREKGWKCFDSTLSRRLTSHAHRILKWAWKPMQESE